MSRAALCMYLIPLTLVDLALLAMSQGALAFLFASPMLMSTPPYFVLFPARADHAGLLRFQMWSTHFVSI
jgi:hypothetical protein